MDHIQKHQEEQRARIANSYKSESIMSEDELTKSANEYFEKGGKKANVGEVRKFGGKDYIKTASGWRPVGKNKGKYKDAHETVHGKKESPQGLTKPSTEILITEAMVDKVRTSGAKSDKEILNAMKMYAQEVGNTYTITEYNELLQEYKDANDYKQKNSSKKHIADNQK